MHDLFFTKPLQGKSAIKQSTVTKAKKEEKMKRKALFIGVNDYVDNQIRNLSCSVRDAHSMNDIFEEIGYAPVGVCYNIPHA